MTSSKWLVLRTEPFLDDVLAIFSELSSVLDTKAVVEHILNFFQSET